MNFLYVLVIVKGSLLVWGILGFIEFGIPSLAFGLQNVNFPAGVQFLHWFLLVSTGSLFIVGFIVKWNYTPFATIIMYATLATLCFVETIDFNAFGGGNQRFLIMAGEYLLYIALSAYLLKSEQAQQYFLANTTK